MLKDNHQDHRYFFIIIQVKENLIHIHIKLKACIKVTIFYLTKVNNINANVVLDSNTSQIAAKLIIGINKKIVK